MTEIPHQVGDRIGPGSVSAARTGDRTYEGMNERGDTVRIGPAGTPGHFTPGELFKLALAGCAAMSADRVTARRLGKEFAMTVWAHGTTDDERYQEIDKEILVDLSALDEPERAALIDLMERSIERSCTVERSVKEAIALRTTIDGAPTS